MLCVPAGSIREWQGWSSHRGAHRDRSVLAEYEALDPQRLDQQEHLRDVMAAGSLRSYRERDSKVQQRLQRSSSSTRSSAAAQPCHRPQPSRRASSPSGAAPAHGSSQQQLAAAHSGSPNRRPDSAAALAVLAALGALGAVLVIEADVAGLCWGEGSAAAVAALAQQHSDPIRSRNCSCSDCSEDFATLLRLPSGGGAESKVAELELSL